MNPGSIIKLDNFEKTKSFFAQEDVSVEGKYRVRINPIKAEFPDGIPTPDIYIEATKVSDESGNNYFVFSNMMEAEIPSYIVSENLIVGVPEVSTLGDDLTTDPAGSLNTGSDLIRSVEHNVINPALEKEERDRGKIGVYSIEIDSSKVFPGQFPVDSSVVEARRVVLNNTPYYVVDNIMDNYVRPDLMTSDHLVSEPKIIRFETPADDLSKARAAQRVQILEKAKKDREASDQRSFEFEKSTRKEQIRLIKKLNSFIGKHIEIPSELTSENRGSRVMHAFNIGKAVKKFESFKDKFKELPKVGFNISKGDLGKSLIDIMDQIDREEFLRNNGYFVQVSNESNEIKINILDSEDIMIAQAVFDKKLSESKKVVFESDEYQDQNEYIDVLTLNIDKTGHATELGKAVEEEGKLESLWALLATVNLAEEWEDLPSLETAYYDGYSVYDIDTFDANDLIEIMSKDSHFIKDMKSEVAGITSFIDEIKSKSEPDELDNAIGL